MAKRWRESLPLPRQACVDVAIPWLSESFSATHKLTLTFCWDLLRSEQIWLAFLVLRCRRGNRSPIARINSGRIGSGMTNRLLHPQRT
jgi:hypothetical protein